MKAHTPGPPRDRPKAQTTIDHEELSHFSKLADEWWDETGIFEPLHALNEMRVPLVRDALMDQHGSAAEMSARPLEGKVILDVGCGGGILSEVIACCHAVLQKIILFAIINFKLLELIL